MTDAQTMPFALLRRCVAILPPRPPALLLCAMLNRYVLPGLDADTRARLVNRRYVLDVTDAGLVVELTLTGGQFAVAAARGQADLRVAASAADFIQLAAREVDADTLFFRRRLVMQGDTELGLIVRNAVDAIDLDAMRGGRLVQSVLRGATRFVAMVER